MGHAIYDPGQETRPAWNVGRKLGAKRPLLPKQVWAVRFFLEQELTREGGKELGDADGRGVSAMGGAKRIVDEEVREVGKLLGEVGIVLLLAGIESEVF